MTRLGVEDQFHQTAVYVYLYHPRRLPRERIAKCYRSTKFHCMLRILVVAGQCSCSMDGRTRHTFGATRSSSSSRTASVQSRRTCVASGAPTARKEWLLILCLSLSAMWSAFLTRLTLKP